jgi:hypothetical protein
VFNCKFIIYVNTYPSFLKLVKRSAPDFLFAEFPTILLSFINAKLHGQFPVFLSKVRSEGVDFVFCSGKLHFGSFEEILTEIITFLKNFRTSHTALIFIVLAIVEGGLKCNDEHQG